MNSKSSDNLNDTGRKRSASGQRADDQETPGGGPLDGETPGGPEANGSGNSASETPGGPSGLKKLVLGGFGGILGYKNKAKGPAFNEFPWEKYLIKEDIIRKWKRVDMAEVNLLLRSYDVEKSEFTNIELEKVSMVMFDTVTPGE